MSRVELSSIDPDTSFLIADVRVPATHLRRLAELGVRVGASASMVQRTAGRGLVIRVEGCRIALDRATAASIEVEPVT